MLSYVLSRLGRLEAPLVRHREIEGYPSTELKALVRQGLLVTAPPAEFIVLRTGPHSGRLVAVRPTDSGWCGVDEDDSFFSPVPLTDEDVWQYSISVTQLIRIVRNDNGIEGEKDPTEAGVIAIGQRQVDGYGVVEVYLSLAAGCQNGMVSQCLSLLKPAGVRKLVILVPCPISIAAGNRQLLDARGLVLLPLSPLADRGSLAIDWEGMIAGSLEDRSDGVYPPRTIVVGGREYKCDMNKQEMAFVEIALRDEHVALARLIHRGPDALWQQSFVNTRTTRNKVTKLLSRLNKKLAAIRPPFPFFFSLPRGGMSVVRTTEIDAS